ncbi:DUF1893 domain-containing protein [Chloroflexota bacterium]
MRLFDEFLMSGDSLQVYEGSRLIFASTRDKLLALMEYINDFRPYHQQVIIFDRIVGNAAALLAVVANCQEAYSPLGSQLAIMTLDKYGIKYHCTEIVPYIQQQNREDMCPMEELSIDKEPEEFYEVMRSIVGK